MHRLNCSISQITLPCSLCMCIKVKLNILKTKVFSDSSCALIEPGARQVVQEYYYIESI